MNDRDRIKYIVIARGFANFFVVLLHTFVPEIRSDGPYVLTAFFWMNSFTFQLFMMISGYLYERGYLKYRDKGFGGFMRGKLRTIMLPYLTISVFSYAGIGLAFLLPASAKVLYAGGYSKTGLGEAVFQIITYENHIIKHLWFLPTLFIIFLLTFLMGKFFAGLPGLIICLAMAVTSYCFKMPTLIYRVCSMFIFFNIGRRIKFIDFFSSKKWFVPLLAVFIGAFIVDRAGLFLNNRALAALSAVVIGTTGSLTFFTFSKFIVDTAFGRRVSWIGDNSFVIYLLHQPFVVSGVCGVLLMYTALPHPVICAVALVLGISIPCLLNKYLIGRIRLLRGLILGDFMKNHETSGAA